MLQVQITFSLHRGDKLLRIGEMYEITAFWKNIIIWLKRAKPDEIAPYQLVNSSGIDSCQAKGVKELDVKLK